MSGKPSGILYSSLVIFWKQRYSFLVRRAGKEEGGGREGKGREGREGRKKGGKVKKGKKDFWWSH